MPETKDYLFRGVPERVDRFLARKLAGFSRTRIQRFIKEGRVAVNGSASPSGRLLSPGDKVRATLPDFTGLPSSSAEDVPVLYEDEALLVVDKPAGLVVHPAGPHREGTLIQKLWPKLAEGWAGSLKAGSAGGADRPGVVHRLDRGTSGVMVIAKTPEAAENLSRQFAEREVEKIYWALAQGVPRADQGSVRSMVGRSRRRPGRMSVESQGRWSEMDFKVLARFDAPPAAFLEVRPRTGRTHQIRVQLAALGHAIVGDGAYGPAAAEDAFGAARPLLHAAFLRLRHPATGRALEWNAPLPEDFEAVLKALGWKGRTAHGAAAAKKRGARKAL
ncbi:MAG: RluA family pseudouridine synthase [Elusimicrobiota bacterium]